MALSMRSICVNRTNLGFRCVEKKVYNFNLNNNFIRHLRGSRLGKDLNKDDVKYRNLLKTLREESSKPVVYHSGNIPVGEVSSPQNNNSTEETEKIEPVVDNPYKKLEEKITPLKDISYVRQLQKKYNKSLVLLRVLGQKLCQLKVPIALGEDFLPCPVDLMIPSPSIVSYRNQDEFSVGLGWDENPKTVGFLIGNSAGNPSVLCVPPDELVIIKDSHKEFLKDFQNYLIDSPLAAYVNIDNSGYWRSLRIRSNLADEIMGTIVIHPQELTKEELFEEKDKLKEYFSITDKPYILKSLYLQTCIQRRCETDEENLSLLFGDPFIEEEFNNMKIQISVNSYFPSNTKAMESAYESLVKLCKVKNSTTIIDIFCGTGSLSLTMSPYVQKCIGIDSCTSSIKDAKQNALINNRHNVKFFQGNVEYMISELLSQDYHEDIIVIINPSRTELSKTAIKCLRACKYLKKIVYITTKTKTAAEHFVRLCKPSATESYLGKYFVPILAVPVDLYPQTDHFGVMIMFQRI